jgi:hypothetical protein
LLTLERGDVKLHLGSEALLTLRLPAALALGPAQLLCVPQPPALPPHLSPGTSTPGGMDTDYECDAVFAPLVTDNEHLHEDRAAERRRVALEDLGPVVGVTHACSNAVLLHFARGVNVQATVGLCGGAGTLVSRCCGAMRAAMLPPRYRQLLRELHQCAPSSALP